MKNMVNFPLRKLNLIFFAISIAMFGSLNFIPSPFYEDHRALTCITVSVAVAMAYVVAAVFLRDDPFKAWKKFITMVMFMSSGLLSEYLIYIVQTNGFSPFDWMGTMFFCGEFVYVQFFSLITFWLVFFLLKNLMRRH
jgi:hypothetical protein